MVHYYERTGTSLFLAKMGLGFLLYFTSCPVSFNMSCRMFFCHGIMPPYLPHSFPQSIARHPTTSITHSPLTCLLIPSPRRSVPPQTGRRRKESQRRPPYLPPMLPPPFRRQKKKKKRRKEKKKNLKGMKPQRRKFLQSVTGKNLPKEMANQRQS